ncbi:MAG: hypothetical protein V1821_01835 [bacterium]
MGVANEIIRRIGDDTWSLNLELDKLLAYAHGAPISLSMVALLVTEKPEDEIFALVDALAASDRRRAFRLLNDQLELGANALYLLSMIGRQARLILAATSAYSDGYRTASDLAKALGVHPFVAKKMLTLASRPSTWAGNLMSCLVKIDEQIKRGRIDGDTAIVLAAII